MATSANDLLKTGLTGASALGLRIQPTGQGSGYQPPQSFVGPTVLPTPVPGRTPVMPTTEIPEAFTSSGIFQGSEGYNFPAARIMSVPVQRLSGTTDFYAASVLIPFPFVIRSVLLWAPAAVLGGNSDGTIDLRVGVDSGLNATAFNTGVGVFFPPAVPRTILCPAPLSLGELWVPFAEGHMFITAHCASLGGATNVQCVCMVGISPLDDFIGL